MGINNKVTKALLLKAIQCNAPQSPDDSLHRSRKTTLKFMQKYKDLYKYKYNSLRKKNSAGGISTPEFMLHYRTTVTKNSTALVPTEPCAQTNTGKTQTYPSTQL